jgi:signal transduction histidine kinase
MWVWHFLVFGTMAFMQAILWSGAGSVTHKAAVTAMVVAQAALYLHQFGGLGWDRLPSHLNFYFTASLGLCFGEWLLEPAFGWMTMMYIGQMTGLLPPKRSLPVCLLIVLLFDPPGIGLLHPDGLSLGATIPRLLIIGSVLALGSFVQLLASATHRQRALIGQLDAAKRGLEAARERDMELAALRERERLARDLHDSLGHALVTLTVQLQAVQRLLHSDPAKTLLLTEDMQRLTRSTMDDLRRSLANLRAPGLGDSSLTAALRACVADLVRRSGMEVKTDLDDGADRLPQRLAEVLWRVGQEALANAEKHASAKHVALTIRLLPGEVRLRVEDDGIGLPVDAENKRAHYGLRGLRERVEGVGGTFTLSGGISGGTVVGARVPVVV